MDVISYELKIDKGVENILLSRYSQYFIELLTRFCEEKYFYQAYCKSRDNAKGEYTIGSAKWMSVLNNCHSITVNVNEKSSQTITIPKICQSYLTLKVYEVFKIVKKTAKKYNIQLADVGRYYRRMCHKWLNAHCASLRTEGGNQDLVNHPNIKRFSTRKEDKLGFIQKLAAVAARKAAMLNNQNNAVNLSNPNTNDYHNNNNYISISNGNNNPHSNLLQTITQQLNTITDANDEEENEKEKKQTLLDTIRKRNKLNIYVGEYDTYNTKNPANIEKIKIYEGKLCASYFLNQNLMKKNYEVVNREKVDVKKIIQKNGGIFIPNDMSKTRQKEFLSNTRSSRAMSGKKFHTSHLGRDNSTNANKGKLIGLKLNKANSAVTKLFNSPSLTQSVAAKYDPSFNSHQSIFHFKNKTGSISHMSHSEMYSQITHNQNNHTSRPFSSLARVKADNFNSKVIRLYKKDRTIKPFDMGSPSSKVSTYQPTEALSTKNVMDTVTSPKISFLRDLEHKFGFHSSIKKSPKRSKKDYMSKLDFFFNK